jgi:peptidase E
MPGHIVAIGGVSAEADDSALDRFVLGLAGVAKPRVCFLPTASGDAAGYVDAFYGLFPRSVCEPRYHRLVADATLQAGYAADDGAALHFEGTEFVAAVSSRRTARAYYVERSGDSAREEALPTTLIL